MGNEKFNLIDENWILAVDEKCRLREVSIREFFRNAHTYSEFCGETVSQDFAVMRMLLAILHTAVERYDIEGNEYDFFDQDPVSVWMNIWNEGKFSEKQIGKYLDEWHERFYLFHDKYPFYQVPEMPFAEKADKKKMIQQMDGAVSESDNKHRLFSGKMGVEKNFLRYSEAARWLIHYQGFSDCGQKCQNKKNKDSAYDTPGWCGRISPVYAVGKNLFETLMLNCVMELPVAEQHENQPVWEREIPDNRESVRVNFPDNLAALYTLQSRRIKLLDNGADIQYFYTTYGEIPESEDGAGREPMTFLGVKKDSSIFIEKPSKAQSWRKFPFAVNYLDSRKKEIIRKRPLVADWIHKLVNCTDTIPQVFFRTVSVFYGTSNGCIDDICHDEISFGAKLFVDGHEPQLVQIMKEVEKIDAAEYQLELYANNLAVANGIFGKEGKAAKARFDEIKGAYYRSINEPFLQFLQKFCGEDDEIDAWHVKLQKIILDIGETYAKACGRSAYVGRKDNRNGGKGDIMTVSRALVNFERGVRKIYGKQQEN